MDWVACIIGGWTAAFTVWLSSYGIAVVWAAFRLPVDAGD
jgi:hypothetical protein